MSASNALRASGLAAVLVWAGAAAPRSPSSSPRTHRVEIRELAFRPARLEVARGDTVVWRNEDVVPHTVTAEDGAWSSGEIAPGGEFTRIVRSSGEVSYLCRYHPVMTGSLRAAAPTLSSAPPRSP